MEPDNALATITKAKQALANARDISDVLDVRDAAVAAHAYATARNADDAAQIAMEIKLRAERKAGEFIIEMKENGSITRGGDQKSNGQHDRLMLKDVGVSHAESKRWQRIAKIAEEWFEKYILDAKKRTQSALLKLAKKLEPDEENPRPDFAEDIFIELHEGQFQDVSLKIEDNSIDYIITDPPYGKQYLELYEDLGKTAERVLKNGGSLLVLTGQSYLPEIISHLKTSLNYNWIVAYLTPGGQSTQLWQRKVNTFWKPVLWFVKGKYEGKWLGDVAKSRVNDNDKRFMEWQQSESGIMDLVERFTDPGDLIMDPFMGSGTTGYVAAQIGRNFIGIDSDPNQVEIARKRMGVPNDS